MLSPRPATLLAGVLMAAGLALAGAAARQSLYVSVGLAVCILAYDAVLKSTPLGPVAMGTCRFLNVMLGASAYDTTFSVWTTPQTYIAAAMGVYVAGVTWFARNEASRSGRGPLAGAAAVINVGLAALCAFVVRELLPPLVPAMARIAGPAGGGGDARSALILLAVVIFTINRRVFRALGEPEPAKVQDAVKVMLLSLVTLDAAIVYFKTGDPYYTFGTIALLAPAMLLGRWIFIT